MAKATKRPAEAWTYVLEADRALDRAEQSRFTLSPMTYAQRAAARDAMIEPYKTAGEIVVDHVVAIENFPAGAPQPWPTKRDDRRKYLELLDDDAVLELGNEVWTRSTLGVDEESVKNSSPPEPISSSGDTSPKTISSTPAPDATPTPA